MLNDLAVTNPYLPMFAGLAILVFAAFAAAFITKRLWLALVRLLVTRTHTTWDDALVKHGTFGKLAQIVPGVIIYRGVLLLPDVPDLIDKVVQNAAAAWIVASIAMAINSALSAFNTIYEVTPIAHERPIKGFIQLGQIAVWLVSIILIVALFINESPVIMLSGLGAMTAVAMIVFQDTLLSLVASIQLTSQKLIRVGDWLEMPSYHADGDVVDVALYNITVQNWDKTYTVIPTNKLVSGAYKNWRGMTDSGGRRIKRS
ncbi:MAG: mechanosensitive ion channel, partial [Gammaproteobacteria bacterium]|nr:mechanosensitive ion channel [Gammaproteobacteria bacterium]